MSGRAEQSDMAGRLSTGVPVRCTAEQVVAARVTTADYVRRYGLSVDELDELLEMLDLGSEVQV